MQRKFGSLTMFENVDTDIGTCFPIHVVVFVSLKVFSWTQIVSKSNIANFENFFIRLLNTESPGR